MGPASQLGMHIEQQLLRPSAAQLPFERWESTLFEVRWLCQFN
jgi:hypothetical protein